MDDKDDSLQTESLSESLSKSSSSGRRIHRRHSRSRKAKKKPPTLGFFKQNQIEIVGGLLLLLGVFLLVENLEIRATLYGKLVWLVSAFGQLFSAVIGSVRGIEFSDFVGIALVIGGVVLLGHRFRSRMISRQATLDSTVECPKCGDAMKRAPRQLGHQVLAFLLYVRIKRYTCSKCPGRGTLWESKRVARNWQ